MTYFKLVGADIQWLKDEIRKGNLFYKHSEDIIPCGAYRNGCFSYDDMPISTVVALIKKQKNIYWRN